MNYSFLVVISYHRNVTKFWGLLVLIMRVIQNYLTVMYICSRNNSVHAVTCGGVSWWNWQHYSSDSTGARLYPNHCSNPYCNQRGTDCVLMFTIRRKWVDVYTHLIFIWPLFSALLPCCWRKWMESWRDKKKWAWWLRNRSGGKDGRRWTSVWRWDTRSLTVRKLIWKGGCLIYWMWVLSLSIRKCLRRWKRL